MRALAGTKSSRVKVGAHELVHNPLALTPCQLTPAICAPLFGKAALCLGAGRANLGVGEDLFDLPSSSLFSTLRLGIVGHRQVVTSTLTQVTLFPYSRK